jgi:parvulin-like peptidyl-prolyl isomerase
MAQSRLARLAMTGRRRKAVVLAACALLIASLATVVLVSKSAPATAIVAQVNGQPITERELKRMMADPTMQRRAQRRDLQRRMASAASEPGRPDQRQEQERNQLERIALRRLILVKLLLEEADRLELKVTDDQLARSQEAVRSGFEDPNSFAEWRKALDVEDDRSLADALRTELLVERVSASLAKGVVLRAGDVEAYYAAHKADFMVPETVHLLIIETVDQKSAGQILQELNKQGADFGAVAKERSKGFRAAEGGDLGWVPVDRLQSEVRVAVYNMKPGQIRGPVQTEAGMLIVKLLDRRAARTKDLAEVRSVIEQSLLRTKQREAIRGWLAEREKNAKVEILVSALRPDAAGDPMSASGPAERAALERWVTSPNR